MKRVLITGASRGLGLELTRQCLARGDRVFAGCRSPETAADLQSLAAEYDSRVTILKLDVLDESTIDAAFEQIRADSGALDLLFNNAGINFTGENITSFSADTALRVFQTNSLGPLLISQRMAPMLKEGNSPKIVNISSEAGSISKMTGFRGYSYYGSKAALNMFTRCLALDPELQGIVVVAIHPGWVQTDMGGQQAPLTAAESVKRLLYVTDGLTSSDSGAFLTYQGRGYPW